jgi:DNA repair/transcription protein MET18/MMS19
MDYCWNKLGSEKWLTENIAFFESNPIPRDALLDAVFAAVSGIIRRNMGSAVKSLLSSVGQAPSDKEHGRRYAGKMEKIFTKNLILSRKETHAVRNRFWKQRAYFELIKPMLPLAWPNNLEDKVIGCNYAVAVMTVLCEMEYEIYEEDAEQVIRLVIASYHKVGLCMDTSKGLSSLTAIATNAPDKLVPFLKTVIGVCIDILKPPAQQEFRERLAKVAPAPAPVPNMSGILDGWVPDNVLYQCRSEVVLLLQGLTKLPSRYLVEHAPVVRRALHETSGDDSRELRKTALSARIAWGRVGDD